MVIRRQPTSTVALLDADRCFAIKDTVIACARAEGVLRLRDLDPSLIRAAIARLNFQPFLKILQEGG